MEGHSRLSTWGMTFVRKRCGFFLQGQESIRADISSHGEREGSMTPKGGHVQPAHTEPRIGRSHEFHHFAGGLPAATFVGERTFRWRGVGSDTRDYFHAPLPRRERVAALLTLRSGTVQCNRAGIRCPHDSTFVPTCKRMKRRGFRLTPFSFWVYLPVPLRWRGGLGYPYLAPGSSPR